jgi:hypothetical protein
MDLETFGKLLKNLKNLKLVDNFLESKNETVNFWGGEVF